MVLQRTESPDGSRRAASVGGTEPDGSRRAANVPNRRGTRHADGYGVLRLVGALDFLGAPSFANDR
ncbi:MAG: hypothetical protein RI963_3590, partial [Planctomycetota bacterium]